MPVLYDPRDKAKTPKGEVDDKQFTITVNKFLESTPNGVYCAINTMTKDHRWFRLEHGTRTSYKGSQSLAACLHNYNWRLADKEETEAIVKKEAEEKARVDAEAIRNNKAMAGEIATAFVSLTKEHAKK